MSVESWLESLDDTHEVEEVVASKLFSENTPSPEISLSLTYPTILNHDPSNLSLLSSPSSSLRHTPTIRFAPLPSPDPDRKRSMLPLGVAARSRRPRPVVKERRNTMFDDPAVDPLLEDPLIMLGKFVKNASQSLWRRVREKNEVQEDMPHLGDMTEHRPVVDGRRSLRSRQWRSNGSSVLH